jgi:hypothetical protein
VRAARRGERVEGAEDGPEPQLGGENGDGLSFGAHDIPVHAGPVRFRQRRRPGRGHNVLTWIDHCPFRKLGQPRAGSVRLAHEGADLRSALAQRARVSRVFRHGGLRHRKP